nr:ribonuclease HII [Mobilicoccus massiliensis]
MRAERELSREGFALVAGMDEVGRGALAGPVSVGVVVVTAETRSAPAGVKDSKLVAPPLRETLAPRVRRWAHAHGVGHAGPDEIDTYGILAALRLAGMRALAACGVVPDIVLLDGKHDWLSLRARSQESPQEALFEVDVRPTPTWPDVVVPRVRTRIKADMTCSSVASASIIAKVERDAHMVTLSDSHPHYGWAINKGYAAPEHRAALLEHGPCDQHRRSWRLLGEEPSMPAGTGRVADDADDGMAAGADPAWVMMGR